MFQGFKQGRDAINLHFRQIVQTAIRSRNQRDRKISQSMAFPVIWTRLHFLVMEHLSNSGIRQE